MAGGAAALGVDPVVLEWAGLQADSVDRDSAAGPDSAAPVAGEASPVAGSAGRAAVGSVGPAASAARAAVAPAADPWE